jgi:DNA mismatch endonuclease (patch repair protein)
MVDVHSPSARSKNMAAIRSRNTKPELLVRRLIHSMGFRFRLNSRLPGRPDLVFPRHQKVIFVHGCFWHVHDCKFGRVTPATRTEFWRKKRTENTLRDQRVMRQLSELGWRAHIVWECEIKNAATLYSSIAAFLKS